MALLRVAGAIRPEAVTLATLRAADPGAALLLPTLLLADPGTADPTDGEASPWRMGVRATLLLLPGGAVIPEPPANAAAGIDAILLPGPRCEEEAEEEEEEALRE